LPVSLKAEGGLGVLVGVVKSGRGVGSSRRSFSESGGVLANLIVIPTTVCRRSFSEGAKRESSKIEL